MLKCKITIDALNNIKNPIDILITAPRIEIFKSWEKEIIKWGLQDIINIDYVWSNSLKKVKKFYHLIVADEIHEYNLKVLGQLRLHQGKGTRILALTGTLDNYTEFHLKNLLQIEPIYTYSIDQAIKDKIISDLKNNV